jgi:hypothetical protein
MNTLQANTLKSDEFLYIKVCMCMWTVAGKVTVSWDEGWVVMSMESMPKPGLLNLPSIFDAQFFMGADRDTDHCLVIAEVRERLSESKQVTQMSGVKRFNLKKRSELEFTEQNQFKIANSFSAFENLNYSEGISRAWESINENMKISAEESLGLYGREPHKP